MSRKCAASIRFPSRDVFCSSSVEDAAIARRISDGYRIASLQAATNPATTGNVCELSIQSALIAALTAFSLLVQGEEEFVRRRGTERYRRAPAAAATARLRGHGGSSKRGRRQRSTARRRMDAPAVATRCGIIGFEKRSARPFRRARPRRPLFGIIQAHQVDARGLEDGAAVTGGSTGEMTADRLSAARRRSPNVSERRRRRRRRRWCG